MVLTAENLRQDFKQALEYGEKVRFRYFDTSGALAGYDDEVTYSVSGSDVWASGLVQPIDQTRGSHDALLLEQGRVLQDDLKLYILGDIDTSGVWKVGIGSGSPPVREYGITPAGVNAHFLAGSIVYKKVYLRYLTNGSLA